MDINPFDQFSAELGAAIPDADTKDDNKFAVNDVNESTPLPGGPNQFAVFDLKPKESTPKKPAMVMSNPNPMMNTMNSNVMSGQSNGMGGGGVMNGGAPGMMGGANVMIGQSPMQQSQGGEQQSVTVNNQMPFGTGVGALDGTTGVSNAGGALVPSSTASNAYAGLVGGAEQKTPLQQTMQQPGDLWSNPPDQPHQPPPPLPTELVPSQLDSLFGVGQMSDSVPPTAAPNQDGGLGLFDSPQMYDQKDNFGGVFDPASAASLPPQQVEEPWGPNANVALQVSNNTSNNDDPFGIFGSEPTPTANATEQTQAPNETTLDTYKPLSSGAEEDGGWPNLNAEVHNNAPSNAGTTNEEQWPNLNAEAQNMPAAQTGAPATVTLGERGLPAGGKLFEATIFTASVGVLFFKAYELVNSIFLETDKQLINDLGELPVVAFMVEDSGGSEAGIEIGHVLLKVNGADVSSPNEAVNAIRDASRPLKLSLYVPDTSIFLSEGMHMVKYDTIETVPPPLVSHWKPKYVVVGGVIGKKDHIYMYRSKAEYDIAVTETHASVRKISVKVKTFSIPEGSHILDGAVKQKSYPSNQNEWNYIVLMRSVGGFPIKIAATVPENLKPVLHGIHRVLNEKEAGRGLRHGGNPRHGEGFRHSGAQPL